MLQHLANHGSYHRGQAAAMLRQVGAAPVATDLILYYRERGGLPPDAAIEPETIRLLREHSPMKGCVVSSFLPQVLVALHGIDASVQLGFICDRPAELELWEGLPAVWIIPQLRLTDQTLIAQIHASSKKVMVWTVNRADEIRTLTECGVDAIVSDETELAAQVLAAS